jgi:HAD superfamily hydrolase (TIGR01549 family)
MTPKAVVFDFDGTIADSFEAALRIANGLAGEFGYRPVRPDEVDELRQQSYRQIAERLGVAWHKIPLIAARMRKELALHFEELRPFEGLPGVVHELQRRGFALGILTSNSRPNVDRFLTAHGIDTFDFISTSASLWGKERRLKGLLKRQGLTTEQIVYVGDEVRDIEATKAIDVCMIAVAWGYSAKAHLAAHLPNHLIDRPEQLLDILRSAG